MKPLNNIYYEAGAAEGGGMNMSWLTGIAIGIVCGIVSALIVSLLFGRK